MAQIIIRNLRKEFGDFVAVQGSTFTVEDGEFFMLLGPSGCGKTTTLRMIAGLELPTSGSILMDGEDVSNLRARERDIAFVFQMFALYPHMNVRRNIAYPLRSQGMRGHALKEKVAEVAGILGIEKLLGRSVGGLSSGDRQRVALARAIVREPKAFLMDEPLGALDTEFREHMASELRALHDRIGATTIYVTHDQFEAMQMGDKIVVMNHGVVEQWGTPLEVYDRPASLFVANFIGSPPMNFLNVDADVPVGSTAVQVAGATVPVPRLTEAAGSGKLILGARPEHVLIDPEGPLRAEVVATEYLGTTQIVTLETPGGRLLARFASSRSLNVGDAVALAFRTAALSLFDAESGKALAVETRANDTAHRREVAGG